MADKIVVFRSKADSQQWVWHRLAPNGEIVAHGESHPSRGNAVRAAWREAGGTDATVEVAEEPDAAA